MFPTRFLLGLPPPNSFKYSCKLDLLTFVFLLILKLSYSLMSASLSIQFLFLVFLFTSFGVDGVLKRVVDSKCFIWLTIDIRLFRSNL